MGYLIWLHILLEHRRGCQPHLFLTLGNVIQLEPAAHQGAAGQHARLRADG
jgi:hypothetical protein